ncbi:MerC domain-containing protein [Caulobacter hibisci]|uniref:MerC domain-containing protein n=1 Tax=Caulobacter hibisci TaxID=2035993 RepID=A0ABS0T1S1_9CAUL|nr:MerC domain-containing protein [Caulobacter hibisci]MBI1685671.1 MerC domain-containing protein [Caulobacter hibisci]
MARHTHLQRGLDGAAIGLSGLCLVHCLALPVMAALLPLAANLSHAEWLHPLFLAMAAPISVFALARSGNWRRPGMVALAAVGLALMTAGAFAPIGDWAEAGLTSLGGLMLAGVHVLNARICSCAERGELEPAA